jgi:uncharacterized protein with NRDE domain
VCTLAFYFQLSAALPVIVAANRDEHYDRPSVPPAVIGERPKILAGKDLRAGGTWLGVNEHGVLAAILNRRITAETDAPSVPRSRGRLCMDMLQARSATEAVGSLTERGAVYNPFSLLVADRRAAHVAFNQGATSFVQDLEPGLHVFSSAAEFDLHSAKAARAYALFGRAAKKIARNGTDACEISRVLTLPLADHSLPPGSCDPADAICVHRDGAGTVSSAIVLLSSNGRERRFRMFYCPAAPCQDAFGRSLDLEVR